MTALARAELEQLLQARKLGATLTSSRDPAAAADRPVAPTGLGAIDRQLGGGWPRGQMSEVVGPLSTGGSWIAGMSLAAATRRGELAALVDPLDVFDPESAAAAGFVWSSFLWIRGRAPDLLHATVNPWTTVVERAVNALALVLQTEGFGLAVLDLHGVPRAAVQRLPLTTWRRLQRLVAGRETACLVMLGGPLARSAGGATLLLEARQAGPCARWHGASAPACRLAGLATHARIVCAARPAVTAPDGFGWASDVRVSSA
jgi:hypothetical protein